MTTPLYEKVRSALERERKSLADIFERQYTSRNTDDRDEIIGLNKYFRLTLTRAPVSTMDERECLIDDLEPGMWFRYFTTHVLPTLVRFDLPKG